MLHSPTRIPKKKKICQHEKSKTLLERYPRAARLLLSQSFWWYYREHSPTLNERATINLSWTTDRRRQSPCVSHSDGPSPARHASRRARPLRKVVEGPLWTLGISQLRCALIERHFRAFDASPPVTIPSRAAYSREQVFARPLLVDRIIPEKHKLAVTVVFVGQIVPCNSTII